MSATIRLLTAEDADIFHALRLRACREEPTSFFETPEEVQAQDSRRYFANGWIAGAFMDGVLVATAGLFRHRHFKERHKGTVWGVYSMPEARGQGLAAKLITRVMEEAKKNGIELVHLSAAPNGAAIATYRKLGFEEWAVDKHVMKLADGTYVDDVLMKMTIV